MNESESFWLCYFLSASDALCFVSFYLSPQTQQNKSLCILLFLCQASGFGVLSVQSSVAVPNPTTCLSDSVFLSLALSLSLSDCHAVSPSPMTRTSISHYFFLSLCLTRCVPRFPSRILVTGLCLCLSQFKLSLSPRSSYLSDHVAANP